VFLLQSVLLAEKFAGVTAFVAAMILAPVDFIESGADRQQNFAAVLPVDKDTTILAALARSR
jgi:hypothetical protein